MQFSDTPSMAVQQVKQYHQSLSLKKNRQILICLLLAGLLLIQYLVMTMQTHQTRASSHTALIRGGVVSKYDIEAEYQKSSTAFSALAQKLNLSREDIRNVSETSWQLRNTTSPLIEWSLKPVNRALSDPRSSTAPTFAITVSAERVYYGKTLPIGYQPANKTVFTNNVKGFFITKASGAIITTWEIAQAHSTCFTTPDQMLSFLNCPNTESLVTVIDSFNDSQNVQASASKLKPNDQLRFTLTLQNKQPNAITVYPRLYVGDLTEYARLTDTGGGRYDIMTENIRWPKIQIAPSAKVQYSFSAKVSSKISLAPQNINNATSHDCKISLFFGVEHNLMVTCPPPKVIERFMHQPYTSTPIITLVTLLIINLILLLRAMLYIYQINYIIHSIKRGEL